MSSTTKNKNIRKAAKLAAKHEANAKAYQMLFGTRSYALQRKRDYQCHQASQKERTECFDLLSDKDQMSKRLVKTKICRNLGKYGKCTREVCHFAHTPKELKDAECVFGKNCRKRKNCTFKHADETSEEYRERRGIRFPETKVIQTEIKQLEPDACYSELLREVLIEDGIKAPPPTPKGSNEEEVVLVVSPEMAKAAMELAISSGRTNIRVELTE